MDEEEFLPILSGYNDCLQHTPDELLESVRSERGSGAEYEVAKGVERARNLSLVRSMHY